MNQPLDDGRDPMTVAGQKWDESHQHWDDVYKKRIAHGQRVYAKYTGYRSEPDGGPWFGATITDIEIKAFPGMGHKVTYVSLKYDDGDTTGDSPARLDEIAATGMTCEVRPGWHLNPGWQRTRSRIWPR